MALSTTLAVADVEEGERIGIIRRCDCCNIAPEAVACITYAVIVSCGGFESLDCYDVAVYVKLVVENACKTDINAGICSSDGFDRLINLYTIGCCGKICRIK